MAYAPDAIPSAPCVKSYGAGASGPMFGASFGGGKIDKGCDSRETARAFALLHNLTAAAKILCSTDAAKRAGLTMEDCLAMTTPPVETVVEQVPAPTPTPVVVNVAPPAPQPAPAPVAPPTPVTIPGVTVTPASALVVEPKKPSE